MEDFFDRDLMAEPARPTPSVVREARPLTADDVREKILEILGALRGAETLPYSPQELKRHKAMFPIMAQWLPKAEGEALVASFNSELQRLEEGKLAE